MLSKPLTLSITPCLGKMFVLVVFTVVFLCSTVFFYSNFLLLIYEI